MKGRGCVAGAIALVVVLSFCGFALWAGFAPLPNANQHYLDLALGALVAQFANVCAYFFGSSRSAERAQDHIETLAPGPKPAPRVTVPPPADPPPT